MEPPSADKPLFKNRCVLDDMPAVLGKLTLALAEQNTSRIHNFADTARSGMNNYPTPNNSPEKLCTKEHEICTKSIPCSDNNNIKPDLLTELDGCNSNKSSVILPSTTRKRLLFDYSENDNTSASGLKKLCTCPISQVQPASMHYKDNDDPSLCEKELGEDDFIPSKTLKYLDKHLHYLIKNIYKSMSKCRTKTSPKSFRRASKHILAFKRLVIDHGRYLANESNWMVVLDYVLVAWKYVGSSPKFDNPTHNTARRQCFSSLLKLYMTALTQMKGTLTEQQRNHYINKLKLFKCADGVKKCLELMDFDSTTQ